MAKTKVATLNEILGTRSRAIFPYRINFESARLDNIPLMRQWCEDNCSSIWRAEQFFAIYFQFENDHDATMFMLRWGTADGNKLK